MKPGWYLIKVKPREELRAIKNLENQAFEVFCPLYQESGCDIILFPGYAFIRLSKDDLERYHKIRSTRGVTSMVSFNQTYRKMYNQGQIKEGDKEALQKLLPQPIPNGEEIIEQIEDIIRLLNGEKPEEQPESVENFKEGDQVCYNNPLFKHLQSTFIKGLNIDRGLILIRFIHSQRCTSGVENKVMAQQEIEVPLGDLKKIDGSD